MVNTYQLLCRYFLCLCNLKPTERTHNTNFNGARPALSQIVVLFYVLFVLCRSVYCLCKCVLYYCHLVTTQLQLTNISNIKNRVKNTAHTAYQCNSSVPSHANKFLTWYMESKFYLGHPIVLYILESMKGTK